MNDFQQISITDCNRLLTPGKAPSWLQCLGRIAAGIPLEAVLDAERDALLALLTSPGRYPLRVRDDSMLEAGIYSGDTLIVQSQQQAHDGDLVIALIDNEQVVLKRIRYCVSNQVQLLADNPAVRRLCLASSRVVIQGKVIGMMRHYP